MNVKIENIRTRKSNVDFNAVDCFMSRPPMCLLKVPQSNLKKSKKKKKRISRWQRIAEEAAKQSQRGVIPEVEDLFTIKELKKIKEEYDLILVLWASEKDKYLSELISNLDTNEKKKILLIVGPEGGFNEKEIDFLKNKLKSNSVSLGPRILRTETAPIVGISIILYELGDLGG